MVFARKTSGAVSPPSTPPLPPILPPNPAIPFAPPVAPSRFAPSRIPATAALPVLAFGRRVPGFALLDDEGNMRSIKGYAAKAFPTCSPIEAFGTEHTSDLHFVCYNVRNTASGALESPAPRMTKGVLPLLERVGSGLADLRVVGTALAIDYDLPNHAKWTPGAVTEVMARLAQVQLRAPVVACPSLFYTTAKGLRLVWFLSEPIPVDGARGLEDLLGGIIALCVAAGLDADPSCRDWTRIFRLPRVRREDEKVPGEITYTRTVEQAYLHQSWGRIDFHANEAAPADGMVLVHPPTSFRALSEFHIDEFSATPQLVELAKLWKGAIGQAPATVRQQMLSVALPAQPSDADVATLLGGNEAGTSGSLVLTHSIKSWITGWAKIKGRNQTPPPSAVFAFEVLYGGKPLVSDPTASGQLHVGVIRLARAMCFTLREQLEKPVTPEMIYALVLQVARRSNALRLENRRDDATLASEVWNAVGWAYTQFRSQTLIEQEQEQQDTLAKDAYLRTQMILSSTAEMHIKQALMAFVRRDGDDPTTPLLPAQCQWIDDHWQSLLLLRVQKEGTGVFSFGPGGVAGYSLLGKDHGEVLSAVRDCGHTLIEDTKPSAQPGQPPQLKTEASLLRDYGTVTRAMRASRLAPCNRLELQPKESGGMNITFVQRIPGMRTDIRPQFDARVHEWLCAMGGASTEKLLDWMAAFPRIDQQCCGLYLQGRPGIGKGMLAKGLANVTESRAFAPFYEVLESFQDTMLSTPFIWMDEDATTSQRTMKSMMQTYKTLITGEFNRLNGKGDKAMKVEGHWRVLICANRDDALRPDKDMTETDLEAIRVRTMHIAPDEAACARVLEAVGGRGGTEGWIETIIPAHIMWLAQNREVVSGTRLLVEGEATTYHQNLATKTEGTDSILRTLAHLLRTKDQRMAGACVLEDEYIKISSSGLLAAIGSIFGDDRSTVIPTSKAVEQSLKHMSGLSESIVTRPKGPPVKGVPFRQMRLWPVKLSTIIRAIYRTGEDADFREILGEERWRACTPPEIVAAYDKAAAEPEPLRPPRLPDPPRPAWLNGHAKPATNGHTNGHANGHTNGHAGPNVPVSTLFSSPTTGPRPN